MYDKSIGGEYRIYGIIIPQTPTLVIDLLTGNDLADYNHIIGTGLPIQPFVLTEKNTEIRKRLPVDGYIYTEEGNFKVSTSQSGSTEPVAAYTQYVVPIFMWLNKTYVSSDTSLNAIIRVFFS